MNVWKIEKTLEIFTVVTATALRHDTERVSKAKLVQTYRMNVHLLNTQVFTELLSSVR